MTKMNDETDKASTIAVDVEKYPELKRNLLQAKKDIEEGKYYTFEEMREMIRSGEL